MPPPIVYDGLRLLLGGLTRTPRGIDRVGYAYARFLFEDWPGECLGLLPTPLGVRLCSRASGLRMVDFVQASWRENVAADIDPVFGRLHQRLTGKPAGLQPAGGERRPGGIQCGLRLLRDNGWHVGRSAMRDAPRNAIYLNTGQLGWAAPLMTHWLRDRPDLRAVFMLHDIIPLEHPDMVSDAGRMVHGWMVNTVIRRAAGLLTTTRAASNSVMETLRDAGLSQIPTCSLHLPVADVFLHAEAPDEALRRHPYFVVCGAIEPRKNHLLLLKVWHRLVQRIGPAAPRLVIVGSPAHAGREILAQFLQAPALRDHVLVVSGMACQGLRRLMANAQAVLMPSLAEGFGLPVIEALTTGTPVLASELPAHREVGEDLAIYLDPLDDVAWFDAITGILDNETQTAALRRRIAGYRPLTASDYFGSIGTFLRDFR